MGTAYLYSRVSSGKQISGSGLDRQVEQIHRWAEHNSHTIDKGLKLSDKGRSAYKGKHLEAGLGQFLELAKNKKLGPEPILCIEAIDRISRLPSLEGLQKVVFALVDADVAIYTSEDDCLYTRDKLQDGPGPLIQLVLRIEAAHAYSKRLGTRVAAAHERQRQEILNGARPKMRAIPDWIDWNGDGYVLNERAALIERMFALSEQGWGGGRIARLLNDEGHRTAKGTEWNGTLVNFWMRKPAVCGTLQLKSGPVDGFYPAVVSKQQWEAATHRRAKVNTKTGGFAAATNVWWVAQGLSTCHTCQRVMGVTGSKDRQGRIVHYLSCPSTSCRGVWNLNKATDYLLDRLTPKALQQLAAEPLDTAPAEREETEARTALEAAKSRLDAAQTKATEAALAPDTPLATVNLLATAMESAQVAVDKASERLRAASAARQALMHHQPDAGPFRAPENADERRALNDRLRRIDLRIVMDKPGNRWGMALGDRELKWATFSDDWWASFNWLGPTDESEPPEWTPTQDEHQLIEEYRNLPTES